VIEFQENPIPSGLKKAGGLAPRLFHLYGMSKYPQWMQISSDGWKFELDGNEFHYNTSYSMLSFH